MARYYCCRVLKFHRHLTRTGDYDFDSGSELADLRGDGDAPVDRKTAQVRLAAQRLQEANEILQAEVTERKQGEETFEKAQKYAESIVETIREPLIGLTPDLRIITTNRSFYDRFHVTLKETEGQFVYSIGDQR